jgi:integrase
MRAEADAECLRQKTLLERHSREAIGLSPREMSDFITAKKKLAEYGKTIGDAVALITHHEEQIRRCKTTILQLAEEVVQAKRKDGRSQEYISDLQMRLSHFCRDFGNRLIATIDARELDNWLRELPLGAHSRTNYRRNIGVMFSYAVDRGMVESNPIARTAKPKLPDTPPEIFTVNELRALLQTAWRVEPSVTPMLAIGAFAGLRDAEIHRLHWCEINLAQGFIDVKAAKAKSARRRVLSILPCLAAWLRSYSGMNGNVVPQGARGKLRRVRQEAGLAKWPKNGLRHSFASYRLEATQDAPKVAHELGHTNPQLLYNTYRALVPPGEAERYWKITPTDEAANVVAFREQH